MNKKILYTLLICAVCINYFIAQNTYGAFAQYGIRKINTTYSGNAIQVRRNCDNATLDIGFNSCGDLNTATLTKFAVLDNTLTGVAASAATAYSLRKLSCTYSGNAIKVRRSSDNTTQDIGFTSVGDLDTISLKAFVGSNSGYVTTWYDQSGNARNASQATNANQPRIVNAGVIERYNGVPSVFFNNTGASGYSICLKTANLNIYTSKACFLGVAAVNTNLTYNCLVVKTNNNNYPSPFDFYYNTGAGTTILLTGNGSSANFFTCSKNFNAGSGMHIWTYQANGTTANGVNAYYDASTQIITNQTATFFGDNSSPVYLGARSDGVTGLNGWISEVLTFTAIPTASDIGFLNYTEGTYYGISGPTYVAPSNSTNLNAYIAKWYDQSGNGNDAIQATPGNQPTILTSGTITLQNSLPSISFSGSTNFLQAPYTGSQITTSGNLTTANFVLQNTSGVNGTLFTNGDGGTNRYNIHAPWGNNNTYFDIGNIGSGGRMSGALQWTSLSTGTFRRSAAQGDVWKNGTNSITSSALAGSCTSTNSMTIGGSSSYGSYMQGYISEMNVFKSALSTTQRTLIETNQGTYYGITVSGSEYTASSGYKYYVNGVGRTSATDSVSATRQSGGMGFIVGTTASDYLKDNGDYITAGMTCPTAAVTTSLYMPTGATSGYERWLNDWYINKTDVSSNGGNLQIYFDFSDYGVSGSPANASNYQLWGRANTTSNFTVVPTTSTAISGDRVIFTLPAANLGTTGYYTIGTVDYQNSPLPIELLTFTAIAEGNKVSLQWATATEIDNNYFTVERSSDGQIFTSIATLKSKASQGNSQQKLNYQLYDTKPLNGTSYYKLRQTDFNGKSEEFNVVSINFEENKNTLFNIFPNPNEGNFKVYYTGEGNLVTIQVYNTIGTLLLSKKGGIENESFTSEINNLDEGVYIVKLWVDSNRPQVKQVIVRK